MLKDFAAKKGTKVSAIDYMDDGSPIQLAIEIDPNTGDALFDFTGTGPQVLANHNAPPAVAYSAVIYSLRSLCAQSIPLNQGCLAPIKFIIPKNSLLNPSPDAGVVGGNVLTSQRLVDVVLKAFSACAASQGCMNNLTFGDEKFGYYETIAGGAGAGHTWEGRSGIHTHCTNTRVSTSTFF
jgi:5-oxoprolinase (ATP-hydrolysing)